MRSAISRSCTTSRRACGSTSPGASPRIATSSASSSTAPSSSACRARPGRPSRRRSDFAKEINPHTIQVSLAAPYPGTFLYKQARGERLARTRTSELVTDDGMQIAPLTYPHLQPPEIFESVEDFYKRFYFRAAQDRRDRRRDGAEPRDDEAAPARRRRVLPLPARAPRPAGLIVAIITGSRESGFRHPLRRRLGTLARLTRRAHQDRLEQHRCDKRGEKRRG